MKPAFLDELKKSALFPAARVNLTAENIQLVDKNSVFFGQFVSDGYTAFVEFDICHSLPVVMGPAYHTGNYTCLHPATLAKSHRCLLHKQTNLHHLIKEYDPSEISRDRIIGAVVMASYPAEPADGWKIPASEGEAIPIHCCAAIFKQAEGALDMLAEHRSGRQKWSVSIELEGSSYEAMGLYFTDQQKLIPFLEAPDEVLMEAVMKDECGCITVGKFHGEQLALCYGGMGGPVIFRGVGFTPTPAEKQAAITRVQMSAAAPSFRGQRSEGRGQTEDYEIEERTPGIMAMCASSAGTALARAAVAAAFKGATMVRLHTEGAAQLKDQFWKLEASAEEPVAEIRLSNGGMVLRYVHELGRQG